MTADGGALCVRFVFFLFMKAILSFFDFWTIFLVVFFFSFHFCLDLPQVSNCYGSDSFIFFDFWTIFWLFFFFFFSFLL